MKITYINWSTEIFDGFYNSPLYNSDTLYWIEEMDREEGYLTKNQEYDINFDDYKQDVAEKAVIKLEEFINPADNIIHSMKYRGINSPQYYNYRTDRLLIDMDVNINSLKIYCFKTYKDNFNQYLKDNFTSYDGFISFVENNLYTFKHQYKEDKNRCLQVMIEFYLLNCIKNTNYSLRLAEYANETIYNYLFINFTTVA